MLLPLWICLLSLSGTAYSLTLPSVMEQTHSSSINIPQLVWLGSWTVMTLKCKTLFSVLYIPVIDLFYFLCSSVLLSVIENVHILRTNVRLIFLIWLLLKPYLYIFLFMYFNLLDHFHLSVYLFIWLAFVCLFTYSLSICIKTVIFGVKKGFYNKNNISYITKLLKNKKYLNVLSLMILSSRGRTHRQLSM